MVVCNLKFPSKIGHLEADSPQTAGLQSATQLDKKIVWQHVSAKAIMRFFCLVALSLTIGGSFSISPPHKLDIVRYVSQFERVK